MRSIALLLPVSLVLFASACDNKDSTEPGDDTTTYEPAPANEAPVASFSSHRDGDTERDGYAFVLEAQVADADHDIADLDIAVTANGTDICEDLTVTDDGLVSCTVTPTEGLLQVTLSATDTEGANAEATVSITVNPTDAPVARIDLPTAENARYYTDIAVDVAAAVSDTETAIGDLQVTLDSDLDTDIDFGIELDADGNLTAGAMLSEGLHTLTLTVVDETGKVGQDSVQFEVGPDNQAPLCTIVGPADGSATLSGEATALDADISDADVGAELLNVAWSSDLDGVLAEGLASADGVTDLDAMLSDGVHQLTVVATDETGAGCAASVTHTVGSAPMVAIDSHANGDLLDEGFEVTFAATVGDAETAADALSIVWTDGSGTILSEAPADSAGVASYTTDALAPGAHDIIVTATDAEGFASSATVSVVVNAKPGVATVSMTPASPTTSSDLEVVIDSDAIDPEGATVTYSYSWSVDGAPSAASTSATLPASATARGETWSVSVVANDGRIDGDAVVANVTIANEAPVASAVSISPDPATTAQDLTCTPAGSDADGDSLSWTYAWTIDGAASSETSATLSSDAFAKGAEIACFATPNDGTVDGTALASATLVITNTAPVIDAASITPDPASSASTLTCGVTASDVDGDSLTTTYAWIVDGADAGVSSSTLGPAYFSRGSEVACTVTVSDGGESDPTSTTPTITIANSAPDMDSVAVNPADATVSDELACVASGSDHDGDSISYSYSWTVNGAAAGSSDTLAAGSFAKGDLVACQAWGNDGFEDGDALESSELIISNADPTVSSVAILPGTARASDTLNCSASYADADGDSLTVSYSWAINGVDAGVTSDILSSGSFVKGDSITCSVDVDDGTATSGVVTSSALVVENTKPAVSSVSLQPGVATVADDIVCSATGTDIDGDSVTFTYEWTIDGVVAGETTNTLASGSFAKGQTIACKVTPNDGTEDGAWAITAGKTVANSVPTVDSIAISPTSPTAGEDLTCGVTGSDVDGDTVSFTYSWTKNGANAGVSTSTLSSFTTSVGDIYTCTATPTDGIDTGVAATSASITIANEPPVIGSVTLSSASPTTDATLTANAVVTDSDGDSTSLSYEWYVGATMVQSGPDNTLSGTLYFDKGESVYAIATANDGSDDSAPVMSNTATVANTAPGAPEVVIDPESPEGSDDLVCMIDVASFDADGDAVSYSFTWDLDGTEWTGATADGTYVGDTIEAIDTSDNDVWSCTATPNDGDDDGPTDTSDDVTVLPSQAVFEVTSSVDLLNQQTCGPDPDVFISGLAATEWGFSWEDTSGRTPAAVSIDFNIGMVCTFGYTTDVYLNGDVIDTISPTFDCGGCAVGIPGGQAYSIVPADFSAYDPNGVNEVTFDYGMWEGLHPNADGNLAVITVDY